MLSDYSSYLDSDSEFDLDLESHLVLNNLPSARTNSNNFDDINTSTIDQPLTSIMTSTTNEHLVIPVTLFIANKSLKLNAMIDSGATSCFIDSEFANKVNIPLLMKEVPIPLLVIDGRSISSGSITHNTIPLQLQTYHHHETISFDVTKLGKYSLIIGINWLKLHNPQIEWPEDKLDFNSEFCK
ncbi:Retrotransposon-derived protein PEG10, partial [Zancudomyces culisetae]